MRAFATERPDRWGGDREEAPTQPRARTEEIDGSAVRRACSSTRAADGGVEEVMRTDVVCVREAEGVGTLRRLLLERRIGCGHGRPDDCVVVVNGAGRPAGIVSESDLLRALLSGTARAIAREVMTELVFALPITASIAQAAALMSYEGVNLIAITDLNGEVAGVVRALDIARWFARGAGYLVDRETEPDTDLAA